MSSSGGVETLPSIHHHRHQQHQHQQYRPPPPRPHDRDAAGGDGGDGVSACSRDGGDGGGGDGAAELDVRQQDGLQQQEERRRREDEVEGGGGGGGGGDPQPPPPPASLAVDQDTTTGPDIIVAAAAAAPCDDSAAVPVSFDNQHSRRDGIVVAAEDDDDDPLLPAPRSWFEEEGEEETAIAEKRMIAAAGTTITDGTGSGGGGGDDEDAAEAAVPPPRDADGVAAASSAAAAENSGSDFATSSASAGGGGSDGDDGGDALLFSSESDDDDFGCQQQQQMLPQPQEVRRRRGGRGRNGGDHHHHSPAAGAAQHHQHKLFVVSSPPPSPSWAELSSEILPAAAAELLSSSMRRACHHARLSYAHQLRWQRMHRELGNNAICGYYRETPKKGSASAAGAAVGPDNRAAAAAADDDNEGDSDDDFASTLPDLPPFSSLPWVERQLVAEWRTYRPEEARRDRTGSSDGEGENNDDGDDSDDVVVDDDNDDGSTASSNNSDGEEEFDRARHLVPQPVPRPAWRKAEVCYACRKTFGPTRLRHHCRLCGQSFCHPHSSSNHKLPHLGYHPDVPERVCDTCKRALLRQNLAERVAWRLARCRDCEAGKLTPYFETGVDTVEDAALRVTRAALAMARSIPLGAQATIAVETVDVLRQYGLNGIYTIMLRQEFLAAADMLRKALRINRSTWPLSVHELSAAIFYALAQHRAMRGMNPEREHLIHSFRSSNAREPQQRRQQQQQLLREGSATKGFSVVVDSDRPADDAAIYKSDGDADIVHLVSARTETLAVRKQEDAQDDSKDEVPQSGAQQPEPLPFQPVCDPTSDTTLDALLLYAPLALNFIYAEREVDLQLLAAQQGWRLLYAYLHQEIESGQKLTDRPASAFFVHEEKRVACIAVRGTSTIHDIVTDIRQVPVPFPETDVDQKKSGSEEEWTTVFKGNGLAVCGMAGAAVNLYREHIDSILFFARRGYRIRFTGHSLGGAAATLLGALVFRDLEREGGRQAGISPGDGCDEEECSEAHAPLKVYAYGTPSCVDARLADSVASFVTTVVLHDDVVPRLTPASCRGLLKHLLHIRETWVKEHLPGDIMAITERVKKVWAPRWRGSFTLTTSSTSIKKYCRKQLQNGKKKLLSVKEKLVGEDCVDPTGCCGGRSTLGKIDERSEDMKIEGAPPASKDRNETLNTTEQAGENDTEQAEGPRLLLDYMGGMDSRTEGVVIDGDEFFDPNENLLEGSDCDSECSEEVDESMFRSTHPSLFPEKSRLDTEDGADDPSATENDSGDESPGAVILEETPLPKMFIPGKVVHIYSHRGVYRAACVPRTFRELRRISLAGNMLSDHRTKSYYDALLEVQSVRNAIEHPPKWTAFDEDDTCSCCASRFTWASTSDSEAQECRDKHNCRSCGTLVCHPCSTNKIPLPSIGLTVPARVCDRCYNDIGGMLTKPKAADQTSCAAVSAEEGSTSRSPPATALADKPERQRERRSAIVDDLASRVQASGSY